MATDDPAPLKTEPTPVLADWWVWGSARLLGHFAWARESPYPERWLAQCQHR